MKNEQDDIVKALLPKYLAGEASAEEASQVSRWANESEENRTLLESFKKVMDRSTSHFSKQTDAPGIDIDQEWSHFLKAIGQDNVVSMQPSRSWVWYSAAAAVALILAITAVFYLRSSENMINQQTADNIITVSLPDGSQVTLNRYSHLTYSTSFGKDDRRLSLQGEAFFNVTPDKSKPFIITSPKTSVEVVGTSFNVRAYDSLTETEVTVATGIVKFASRESKEEVSLKAGERGVFSTTRKNIVREENKNINFQSWNTQRIVFQDTDLASVVETLGRTYHVSFTLPSSVPDSCVVTVTFDHQSLEAVLHVLKSTLNLEYVVKGNRIEITHAGC